MSFINKDKPVELNGLQFKCDPAKADEVKADLQEILNKIKPEDIKKMKSAVSNSVTLALLRNAKV